MDPILHDTLCEQLDRLYKFAYNRTRDAYKAEDLVQDIVLSAIRSYHGIKDKNLILPWLWGVARNVYLRSLHTQNEIPTEEHIIIDIAGISYETPEDKYIENQEVCNLRRAVSYLAKNYRDVAVMYYIEEKDYNTIARELSIPLSSVKWRLNQSKSQIREELETMDNNYMNEGYRKAQELYLLTPYAGKGWASGNENINRGLESLLAKNIAIAAYEKPVTVTETASSLGVSADYVEDSLGKMVESQAITKINNKYQTNFPIFNIEQQNDIFKGNLALAEEKAVIIINMLYDLKSDIQNLGFYGCDKPFDSLLLMLFLLVCKEANKNTWDIEKLPFKGTDEAWGILGLHEQSKIKVIGLNYSNYINRDACNEYFAFISTATQHLTPVFKDTRNQKTARVLWNLYYSIDFDRVENASLLATLIEEGKIVKNGDSYKILVPIFDDNKNDYERLVTLLTPVIEFVNEVQDAINKRSLETVRKYIPKRLNCDEFFGAYCAHGTIENALYDVLEPKIDFTSDMVYWCRVRNK